MESQQGIACKKLNIGYRTDLIRDITFAVKPGKIVTLIGPNGCGKTTLLKTLTGHLEKRGGTVFVDGDDRQSLSSTQAAKRLSVVMTYRVDAKMMTCREVVEIGRYPYTGSLGILSKEDARIVDESMEWMDVLSFADQRFENLSDGQKQRVLLARAICQEPGILILDEPTSYLDMKHKLDLLQKLTAYVREKKVAVLLSLHELEIARSISDTVVALGDGQVLRIGAPKEVFTEQFIRKLYHIEDMDTTLLGSVPWAGQEAEPETAAAGNVPEADKTAEHEPAVSGSAAEQEKSSQSAEHAKVIMVQGTMSGVGKSMVAAGLCRIFSDDGYRVAPFKSQNMALNSFVTEDGLEMGRAQVMQAECARIKPEAAMNPILLKPTSDTGSQVIVNGRPVGNMKAAEYYKHKKGFTDDIQRAFESLSQKTDIIVIEGAGSPVEMNLKQDDIVNMGMARMADAPVLLVGDIDRGGVFAQLIGTEDLLDPDERSRVKGLIVNKFRGDAGLFEDGIRILEKRSGTRVAGVIPFLDIRLDDEDSLSERFGRREAEDFDIAVIKPGHISNFTDFEPFEQLEGVSVRYVTSSSELGEPDLIILPGSKNTIEDLRALKENGLADAVRKKAEKGNCIIGICGGYQMLGRRIEDPEHVECGGEEEGLCLLPVDTVLDGEKTTLQVKRTVKNATGVLEGLAGKEASGYEIHSGRTTAYEEADEFTSEQSGYCRGNVYGTYLHGFFDKKEILAGIVEKLAEANNKEISAQAATDQDAYKDSQYDMLAKSLRESLDMDYIYSIMGLKNVRD